MRMSVKRKVGNRERAVEVEILVKTVENGSFNVIYKILIEGLGLV